MKRSHLSADESAVIRRGRTSNRRLVRPRRRLAPANWPRPPPASASATKDLPLTWGGKTKENVLLTKTIDGRGYSSPIVWGDQVFLTTMVTKKDAKDQAPENYVVCYKADDGNGTLAHPRPARQLAVGEAGQQHRQRHAGDRRRARLRLWFGDDKIGVLAALNFKGEVQWRFERALGPFSLNPGLCSSPVLYKDTVIQLLRPGAAKQGLPRGPG